VGGFFIAFHDWGILNRRHRIFRASLILVGLLLVSLGLFLWWWTTVSPWLGQSAGQEKTKKEYSHSSPPQMIDKKENKVLDRPDYLRYNSDHDEHQ
jgi:hypothetical protein